MNRIFEHRLRGAGRIARHSEHLPASCGVTELRPIRAQLGTHDYWQLNEHRRRFESIGTAPFMRLARLIRAKLADADVVDEREIGPDLVTGASRVSFAIDAARPQTRQLYQWAYPEHDRSRLAVGTFLGATLIGMRVGQRMDLLDSEDVLGRVQVLAVHGQGGAGRGFED